MVVVPSKYLVSIQLELWLFCCWSYGGCWAVTISSNFNQTCLHSFGNNLKWMFWSFEVCIKSCYYLSSNIKTVWINIVFSQHWKKSESHPRTNIWIPPKIFEKTSSAVKKDVSGLFLQVCNCAIIFFTDQQFLCKIIFISVKSQCHPKTKFSSGIRNSR